MRGAVARTVLVTVLGSVLGAACGRSDPAEGSSLPAAAAVVSAPTTTITDTTVRAVGASAATTQPVSTAAPSDQRAPSTSPEQPSFALTAVSGSFVGRAPRGAAADPLGPAVGRPAFVVDEARWLVGGCCRISVVLQDEEPRFPDDQLLGRFEVGDLRWELFDTGPGDGSLVVAVATDEGLSIAVSGQTLSGDAVSKRSTREVVEALVGGIERRRG